MDVFSRHVTRAASFKVSCPPPQELIAMNKSEVAATLMAVAILVLAIRTIGAFAWL
jgi:hypothetical protein